MTDDTGNVPTNEPLEGDDLVDQFSENVEAGRREYDKRKRAARRDLSTQFQPMEKKGWHETDPEPLRGLVTHSDGNPWLPRGKVGTLIAPGGCGKSQMLIQLAMVVASDNRERQWLDTFDVPDRGPVVLALGEEGEGDLHRRIHHVLEYWDTRREGLAEGERETIARRLYPMAMADKRTALMGETVWPWHLEGTIQIEVVQRLVQTVPTLEYDDARKFVAWEEGDVEFDPIEGHEHADAIRNAFDAIDRDRIAERLLEGWTEMYDQWTDLLRRPPAPDGDGREVQPWKAIILDPASQFIGPEVEKDNAAATRFVQILQTWAAREWHPANEGTGPSVLVAHHSSQSAANEGFFDYLHNPNASRGATGLTNGVRWQANAIDVEATVNDRERDVVGLNVVKFNDGREAGRTYMVRQKYGVLEAVPRQEITFPWEDDENDGTTDNHSDDYAPGT